MTTLEIKTEIKMLIDRLPEARLEVLLVTLKEEVEHPGIDATRYQNFKKILNEDRNLFERLAK